MAIVGRHAGTCQDLQKLQKHRRTFLSGGCGWTTDLNFSIGATAVEFDYDIFAEDKTQEELPLFVPSKTTAPSVQLENSCSSRESSNPHPISLDGASTMLTCPNCLHAFGHPPSGGQPPPTSPASSIPSVSPQGSCSLHPSSAQPTQMVSPPSPLQLPSATHRTTCTVAVSRSSSAPTGGRCSVFVTRDLDDDDDESSSNINPAEKFLPQPSPSVPLSFILPIPAAPTLTTASGQWPSATTTTTMVTNPPSPFLATIVPWTLPPTPSHEGSPSSWPWANPACPSAVVIPAALLVPPPPAVVPSAPPSMPSPAVAPIISIPPAPSPEADLDRLASTVRALRASGWYYEGLSWQGSATVLADSSPGTFLVRDSSDPRFLFALSVQTERGPTSVRLHYSGGRFRLDAEPRLAAMMPLFDGVVRLVEHYTSEGKERANKSANAAIVGNSASAVAGKAVGNHVWVDSRGRVCAHVMLSRPRYRAPPSLQHLARLAINKGVAATGRDPRTAVTTLPLPAVVAEYLTEYPHTL
ncbi:suppressor of cytokine signaling 7-like [Hetaerina americana]|uniref:suppressor of cytokine signaling 7-like n=1 Tax=Hetaerina americana TaxID=62018 RepID=UPI003A7F6126